MSVKLAATESTVLREANEKVLVANVTEGWGDLFANVPKGWKCASCGVITNPFSADQCVACETKRPGLENGWGNLFANVPKGWKCESCGVTTNPFSADQCVACETKRPGLKNGPGGGGAAAGGGVNGEGASGVAAPFVKKPEEVVSYEAVSMRTPSTYEKEGSPVKLSPVKPRVLPTAAKEVASNVAVSRHTQWTPAAKPEGTPIKVTKERLRGVVY